MQSRFSWGWRKDRHARQIQEQQALATKRALATVAPHYMPQILAALEPRRDMELKFQTEPIVAHRVWKLVNYGTREGGTELRLAGVGSHASWPTFQRMEARCASHHHEAPYQTCACGVWALKDEKHVANVRLTYGAAVFGTVNLWGRVLSCELGYRAQYAYPESLFVTHPDHVQPLSDLYGVPVAFTPEILAGDVYVDVTTFGTGTNLLSAGGPLYFTTPSGLSYSTLNSGTYGAGTRPWGGPNGVSIASSTNITNVSGQFGVQNGITFGLGEGDSE